MKQQFLKIILVSLTLMLSVTPSNASDIPQGYETPAGVTCYDKDEVSKLSAFTKRCDRTTLDRKTFEEQYNKCLQGTMCEESITSSRTVFWSSVLGAFVLGFVSASAGR